MLSIKSRTCVELRAPVSPVFPIAAAAASYPFVYALDDWTDLGDLAVPQYVDDAGRLSTWVVRFVMSRPTDTLSLLKDISNGITAGISYQSRETEGTQGPLETLDRGWGSCRDFAVLFAEAVRTLGFGARLVSGYLLNPTANLVGSSDAVLRTRGSKCSFPERAGSSSTLPTDRLGLAISFPSPSRGGSSRLRRSAEVSMGDRQTSYRCKCAWMSKTPSACAPD